MAGQYGQTATRDFDLKGATFGPAARPSALGRLVRRRRVVRVDLAQASLCEQPRLVGRAPCQRMVGRAWRSATGLWGGLGARRACC